MLRHAKRRAEAARIPFNLDETDIVIPAYCPALKIKLARNTGGATGADNSPSLDRIVAKRGYVAGNVIVVSYKANRMKNNATADEIVRVGQFYQRLLKRRK